jgi:crossover junction endodeoxyribonuclease RuvC
MRVLGIDPALAGPTGYGVVESDGRHCRSVHFGSLRPVAKGVAHEGRLREIHNLIARLVKEYAPDAVAIEGIFTALNMKTALKLAEVRGVVMLAAAQGEVPVHSYSPREVKSCVAGYGNADKQQMQQMVRATLGLAQTPQSPGPGTDAADALAVALCHIHSYQAKARIAAATRSAAAGPEPNRRVSRPKAAVARPARILATR